VLILRRKKEKVADEESDAARRRDFAEGKTEEARITMSADEERCAKCIT